MAVPSNGSFQCRMYGEAEDALQKLASGYIAVQYERETNNTTALKDDVITRGACSYKFVATRKDEGQLPQSYMTAICEEVIGGSCDPRCKPVVYMMPVYRRIDKCDPSIGQRIWKVEHIPVNVGYDFQAAD